MPARAQKTTILASGNGQSQASILCDALDALITGAGGKLIMQSTNSGTGFERAKHYRMPHWDYRKSNPIGVSVATGTSGGGAGEAVFVGGVADLDPQNYAAQPASWPNGALITTGGSWTTPALWPSGSTPSASVSTQLDRASTVNGYGNVVLPFNGGLQTWVVDQILSEYGFAVFTEDGTISRGTVRAVPMSAQHMERDVHILGTISAPVPIAAPTGPAHLIIEADGATYNVTFATGSTPEAYTYAQHITMTCGGPVVGTVREIPAERLVISIPPTCAPSAFYVAETRALPRLAITYQDPTLPAAGLEFRLFSGTVTAVAGTTVHKTGVNFALLGARVGGTVRNQTAGTSATILRMSTTSAGGCYDTLVTTAAHGWANPADTYEVFPGPEGHVQGSGAYGAITQIVPVRRVTDPPLTNDPTVDISYGDDFEVVCDDIFGEVYDHFEVGQTVPMHNNGYAAILTVDTVANFIVGEEIVVTGPAARTGTRGIVRGIKASTTQLVVDTVEGYTGNVAGAEAKGVPWAVGDTITSLNWGTGAATISAATASIARATTGWTGLFSVLAKARMDVANGDFRTKLTLDTNAVQVNPSFKALPGAVIGQFAKRVSCPNSANGDVFVNGINGALTVLPPYFTTATLSGTDTDVRRNETQASNLLPTPQNAHMPAVDTSSLEIAETVIRHDTTAHPAAEFVGASAHFRGITSTGAPVSAGDRLDEYGSAARIWRVQSREMPSGENYGAHTPNPLRLQFPVIGPGAIDP